MKRLFALFLLVFSAIPLVGQKFTTESLQDRGLAELSQMLTGKTLYVSPRSAFFSEQESVAVSQGISPSLRKYARPGILAGLREMYCASVGHGLNAIDAEAFSRQHKSQPPALSELKYGGVDVMNNVVGLVRMRWIDSETKQAWYTLGILNDCSNVSLASTFGFAYTEYPQGIMAEDVQTIRSGQLRPGLRPEVIKVMYGEPNRISVLGFGGDVQWSYDSPSLNLMFKDNHLVDFQLHASLH